MDPFRVGVVNEHHPAHKCVEVSGSGEGKEQTILIIPVSYRVEQHTGIS